MGAAPRPSPPSRDALVAAPCSRLVTLGADKAYDAEDFLNELRVDECHAARRAEHKRTVVGDQQTHYAARRLRPQSTRPQVDRGSFRLDEDESAGRRRPNSGDAIASDGLSPSRLRLTIWARLPKLLLEAAA